MTTDNLIVRRPYLFIVAGETGDGKSATSVSFGLPDKPQPYRVVIDGETRAIEYQAQEQDDPTSFQWAYDIYPDPYTPMTGKQWLAFLRAIEENKGWTEIGLKGKPDVVIIDNWKLFNGAVEGWMAKAEPARMLLEQVGIAMQFDGFLRYNFKISPMWQNMVGAYEAACFRLFKRAGIHVIITTPMHNIWKDYGITGYAADGLPRQRIIGRSAVAREQVIQMADVIWILNRRKDVLLAAPEVGQDFHNPKSSIVGVPPTFVWNGWGQIWLYAAARKVAGAESLAKVARPEVTFGGTESTPEGAEDPLKVGLTRLLTELGEGWTEDRLNDVLTKKLGMAEGYALDRHETILAAVKDYDAKVQGRARLADELGWTMPQLAKVAKANNISYDPAQHAEIFAKLKELTPLPA